MKREITFLLIQFFLFAIFFIDIEGNYLPIPNWLYFGLLAFILIGFMILFFGVVNLLGESKKANVMNGNRYVYHGIYKYIRHPIYAGILVAMFGYAIMEVSILKLCVTLIMATVFYFKSEQEERWMIRKYSAYRKYRRTTGRFFPKFHS
ncbi:methyltransferase family protein [Luteirhabdus pelagi]|uniref:methyltransferase family protein n=1 Tax=Luteirhabdus pelagi TaxID=2792783 RepID=UPI00193A2B11|nr:isoprenylcysteine carboxylmethyltransferase family protein [Luteirhabdus pelagi]